MSQPDYTLRTTKHIAAPLADTHQALDNAARIIAQGKHNPLDAPLDDLDHEHWSIKYLDFGFSARPIDTHNTALDITLNVHFSKLPFARSAFEMLVRPQLLGDLSRFGTLSQILAYQGNAKNLATRIEAHYPVAA